MSPNESRRFASGARPDWPKFLIRNIPPALWEQVKARAVAESADGNPRINGICLALLRAYAAQGLPIEHLIDTAPATLAHINQLFKQWLQEHYPDLNQNV